MTSRLVRLASDSCKLTADHPLDGELEVDAEQRDDQAKRQATRVRKKAMLVDAGAMYYTATAPQENANHKLSLALVLIVGRGRHVG